MQKKKSPIKLLLKWAGREKYWIYLSILLSFISGICTMIPYYGIYRLMDAVYNNTCTSEFVMQDAALIIGAIIVRFVLFGASGVLVLNFINGRLFKSNFSASPATW